MSVTTSAPEPPSSDGRPFLLLDGVTGEQLATASHYGIGHATVWATRKLLAWDKSTLTLIDPERGTRTTIDHSVPTNITPRASDFPS